MFMRNVSHVHKNRHQKNAVNKKINQKNGREPCSGFLPFLLSVVRERDINPVNIRGVIKLFDHKGLPFFVYALYNYAEYRYWNYRNRGSVNITCSCDWLLSSEL